MPTKRPRRRSARTSAEIAQRDLLIRELSHDQSVESLSRLTGLSPRQLNRIIEHNGDTHDAEPHLTATELRDLKLEHSASPEALEWLNSQRPDRRRRTKPVRDEDQN